MLSVAKEKYPKLKIRLGEFLKIPYENKYFDVIISTYAFHHLNQKEKVIAIEEMLRVLKDEYYSYIDFLEAEFKKYNKKLEYKRIDKFNYIIQVK